MDVSEAKRIIFNDGFGVEASRSDDALHIANRYSQRREQLVTDQLLLQGAAINLKTYTEKRTQLFMDQQLLQEAIWRMIDSLEQGHRHLLLILQWFYPEEFCCDMNLSNLPSYSKSSRSSFRFTELPPEIQLMVLEFRLRGAETVYYEDRDTITSVSTNHANVLLASKRLYNLGRKTFLDQRSICLFPKIDEGPWGITSRISELLDHQKLSHLSSVQHLKICLPAMGFNHWDPISEILHSPKLNLLSLTICDLKHFGVRQAVTKGEPDKHIRRHLRGRQGPRWFNQSMEFATFTRLYCHINVPINIEFTVSFRYQRENNRVFTTKAYGFNATSEQFYKNEVISQRVEKRRNKKPKRSRLIGRRLAVSYRDESEAAWELVSEMNTDPRFGSHN